MSILRRGRPVLALLIAFAMLPVLHQPPAQAAGLDVGVLDSASSKAFSAGQPPHPYAQGTGVQFRIDTAKTWVEQSGNNLVVLSDQDLENPSSLTGLDVIIIPRTWAMSENASLTLRNWVKQGGGLIPIMTSPRVFLDGSTWRLWVEALNYEAWEWGPLSEAYQMMFVDDPSPQYWESTLAPGHPIVSDTLSALSIPSAKLKHTIGPSGVEFGYSYNSNVTSILTFGAMTGSNSAYNGFSAAQATHYGSGRVVYFDIPVLDFLPYAHASLANVSVGGGHDQGDLADALLDAAVDWAANGGGYGSVIAAATTWGEVDVYQSAIYVRHWVKNIGTAAVSGTLTARFFSPSGALVEQHEVADLGIEPGKTHMYSWSYIKGSQLANGQYRVELDYRYSYPTYTQSAVAEAYVVRSQGQNIPTTPVAIEEQLSPLTGDFDANGEDDIATFSTGEGLWTVLESDGADFDPVQWADFSTASGWLHRMAADFSGDGRDDIAQFHPSNGTWWVSRSTGSSFATTKWADFSTASGWQAHMSGDYNGDGRDDIAQFHPSNGTWWISRSTGTGFATTKWADFSTASGWQARMSGDFNGDGRDDIAQFHPSNGTWWISRSTGTGFVTELWADFTTASGWLHRMVGDFNGDGRDDIAQFHPSNGTWWISRSTGSGFVTELWADFTTTAGWQAHMTGDYNGDGRDDIAQFHPSNGTWWISRSTGTGFVTSLWADFSTASGWQARMTGDYTGDGRDDIAQYHPNNGTWWISRSTGAGFSTTNWSD